MSGRNDAMSGENAEQLSTISEAYTRHKRSKYAEAALSGQFSVHEGSVFLAKHIWAVSLGLMLNIGLPRFNAKHILSA